MPKWTEYTSKDTLADNDEVMLYDATGKANKRGLMSKFWDYVVDKMATAVISKLETDNKTIIGAINALNSDAIIDYHLDFNNQGSYEQNIKYILNLYVSTPRLFKKTVIFSCRIWAYGPVQIIVSWSEYQNNVMMYYWYGDVNVPITQKYVIYNKDNDEIKIY